MFGIGMPEMLLILAIALIVIGPKKLPDLAKSLGRAMREFKKATSEFKDTLQIDDELKEVKGAFDNINKDLKDAVSLNDEPGKKADKKAADSEAEEPGKTLEPDPDDTAVDENESAQTNVDNSDESYPREQKLDDLKNAFEDWNSGKDSKGDDQDLSAQEGGGESASADQQETKKSKGSTEDE